MSPINPPAEITKIEAIKAEIEAKVYFNRRPLALLLAVVAAGLAGGISPLAIPLVGAGICVGLLMR